MLQLQRDDRPDVAHKEWFLLLSGRCKVGILRLDRMGWRPDFWSFAITALNETTTGVPTSGTAKTRDRCLAYAQQCWADQLEALGLQPTSEQVEKSPLSAGVAESGADPQDA